MEPCTSVCLFCNSAFSYDLESLAQNEYIHSSDELRKLKIMILIDFKISHNAKPFSCSPSSLPVCLPCTPKVRNYIRLKDEAELIQHTLSEERMDLVTKIVENFIDAQPTSVDSPFKDIAHSIFMKWRFKLLNNPRPTKSKTINSEERQGKSDSNIQVATTSSKEVETRSNLSTNLIEAENEVDSTVTTVENSNIENILSSSSSSSPIKIQPTEETDINLFTERLEPESVKPALESESKNELQNDANIEMNDEFTAKEDDKKIETSEPSNTHILADSAKAHQDSLAEADSIVQEVNTPSNSVQNVEEVALVTSLNPLTDVDEKRPEKLSLEIKNLTKKEKGDKMVISIDDKNPSEVTEVRCTQCSKICRNKEALEIHSKKHNKLYNCPTCNKEFALRDQLRRHINHPLSTCGENFKNTSESESETSSTSALPQTTKSKTSSIYLILPNNEKNNEPLNESNDEKNTTNSEEKPKLTRLVGEKIKTLGGIISLPCPICQTEFKNHLSLKHHIRRHDKRIQNVSYYCPSCTNDSKVFSNPKEYIAHFQTHQWCNLTPFKNPIIRTNNESQNEKETMVVNSTNIEQDGMSMSTVKRKKGRKKIIEIDPDSETKSQELSEKLEQDVNIKENEANDQLIKATTPGLESQETISQDDIIEKNAVETGTTIKKIRRRMKRKLRYSKIPHKRNKLVISGNKRGRKPNSSHLSPVKEEKKTDETETQRFIENATENPDIIDDKPSWSCELTKFRGLRKSLIKPAKVLNIKSKKTKYKPEIKSTNLREESKTSDFTVRKSTRISKLHTNKEELTNSPQKEESSSNELEKSLSLDETIVTELRTNTPEKVFVPEIQDKDENISNVENQIESKKISTTPKKKGRKPKLIPLTTMDSEIFEDTISTIIKRFKVSPVLSCLEECWATDELIVDDLKTKYEAIRSMNFKLKVSSRRLERAKYFAYRKKLKKCLELDEKNKNAEKVPQSTPFSIVKRVRRKKQLEDFLEPRKIRRSKKAKTGDDCSELVNEIKQFDELHIIEDEMPNLTPESKLDEKTKLPTAHSQVPKLTKEIIPPSKRPNKFFLNKEHSRVKVHKIDPKSNGPESMECLISTMNLYNWRVNFYTKSKKNDSVSSTHEYRNVSLTPPCGVLPSNKYILIDGFNEDQKPGLYAKLLAKCEGRSHRAKLVELLEDDELKTWINNCSPIVKERKRSTARKSTSYPPRFGKKVPPLRISLLKSLAQNARQKSMDNKNHHQEVRNKQRGQKEKFSKAPKPNASSPHIQPKKKRSNLRAKNKKSNSLDKRVKRPYIRKKAKNIKATTKEMNELHISPTQSDTQKIIEKGLDELSFSEIGKNSDEQDLNEKIKSPPPIQDEEKSNLASISFKNSEKCINSLPLDLEKIELTNNKTSCQLNSENKDDLLSNTQIRESIPKIIPNHEICSPIAKESLQSNMNQNAPKILHLTPNCNSSSSINKDVLNNSQSAETIKNNTTDLEKNIIEKSEEHSNSEQLLSPKSTLDSEINTSLSKKIDTPTTSAVKSSLNDNYVYTKPIPITIFKKLPVSDPTHNETSLLSEKITVTATKANQEEKLNSSPLEKPANLGPQTNISQFKDKITITKIQPGIKFPLKRKSSDESVQASKIIKIVASNTNQILNKTPLTRVYPPKIARKINESDPKNEVEAQKNISQKNPASLSSNTQISPPISSTFSDSSSSDEVVFLVQKSTKDGNSNVSKNVDKNEKITKIIEDKEKCDKSFDNGEKKINSTPQNMSFDPKNTSKNQVETDKNNAVNKNNDAAPQKKDSVAQNSNNLSAQTTNEKNETPIFGTISSSKKSIKQMSFGDFKFQYPLPGPSTSTSGTRNIQSNFQSPPTLYTTRPIQVSKSGSNTPPQPPIVLNKKFRQTFTDGFSNSVSTKSGPGSPEGPVIQSVTSLAPGYLNTSPNLAKNGSMNSVNFKNSSNLNPPPLTNSTFKNSTTSSYSEMTKNEPYSSSTFKVIGSKLEENVSTGRLSSEKIPQLRALMKNANINLTYVSANEMTTTIGSTKPKPAVQIEIEEIRTKSSKGTDSNSKTNDESQSFSSPKTLPSKEGLNRITIEEIQEGEESVPKIRLRSLSSLLEEKEPESSKSHNFSPTFQSQHYYVAKQSPNILKKPPPLVPVVRSSLGGGGGTRNFIISSTGNDISQIFHHPHELNEVRRHSAGGAPPPQPQFTYTTKRVMGRPRKNPIPAIQKN